MAGGMSRLNMARTQITVAGEVVARHATVTVVGQDACAVDLGSNVNMKLAVADVVQLTRRTARIIGQDGTVWECTRMGGG